VKRESGEIPRSPEPQHATQFRESASGKCTELPMVSFSKSSQSEVETHDTLHQ
jgi:hypothetical protein